MDFYEKLAERAEEIIKTQKSLKERDNISQLTVLFRALTEKVEQLEKLGSPKK